MRNFGRKDIENSKDAALGFVDNEENYRSLLVDGRLSYGKKWVIDFDCSLHVCCEKKKITKLSLGDIDLVTLPNDEKMKICGRYW